MAAGQSLRDIQARLRADQSDKRPLIEQAHNRWREEKTDYTVAVAEGDNDIPDLDDENCSGAVSSFCTSRRFRKMILYATLALVALYYVWSSYVRPRLQEEWAYKEGFVSHGNETYGIAKGGDLDADLVRLQHLDHKLLPGGPLDPHGKRRLVFIGDVHGCKKELLKLLDKVDFDEKLDHLILTGDVISKGPDNAGVLDELIRLRATSVRGNHEDRVLHVAKSLNRDGFQIEARSSKGIAKDIAMLKHLSKHHLEYLRDMPLMLHIPALPQALAATSKSHSPIREHIMVVHAGLVPGVDLDKQDPYFVMNMRSINRRTHVPSALRDGKNAKPWFDVWSWYNDRIFHQDQALISQTVTGADKPSGWIDSLTRTVLGHHKGPRPQPRQVVYGHDSKAGLQIKRWSKGIDSGCVSGGELTAMVLDARGHFKLHSVHCKNYR